MTDSSQGVVTSSNMCVIYETNLPLEKCVCLHQCRSVPTSYTLAFIGQYIYQPGFSWEKGKHARYFDRENLIQGIGYEVTGSQIGLSEATGVE